MGFLLLGTSEWVNTRVTSPMSIQQTLKTVLLSLCALCLSEAAEAQQSSPITTSPWQTIKGKAQGTTYQIKYLPSTSFLEKKQIDSILADIDQSLSLYRPGSNISNFNRAKVSSPADNHLLAIIPAAISIQKLSLGTFDIRLFNLSQAWGFGPSPSKHAPSTRKINKYRPVTADSIWMHDGQLHKSRQHLKIDLDGMAQGYCVDILADFIQKNGVHHYMVELGGEIRTYGHRADGTPWRIGIESPINEDSVNNLMVAPGNAAITTSGSYRKTRIFDGKVYAHVIDPRTGRPIDNGMISCTVIAPTAMLADALDNVGMVLGPAAAIRLFSEFDNVDAYFVWKEQDGKLKSTSTPGFLKKIIKADTLD